MTRAIQLFDFDSLLGLAPAPTCVGNDCFAPIKPDNNPFGNPALDIFVSSPVIEPVAFSSTEGLVDAFLEAPSSWFPSKMTASVADCTFPPLSPVPVAVPMLTHAPPVSPTEMSECSVRSISRPHSPVAQPKPVPTIAKPQTAMAKAEDRRRRNRESSSRCYYNRKRKIEARLEELGETRRYAVVLYARELELRSENARLKKGLVMSGGLIPRHMLARPDDGFGN